MFSISLITQSPARRSKGHQSIKKMAMHNMPGRALAVRAFAHWPSVLGQPHPASPPPSGFRCFLPRDAPPKRIFHNCSSSFVLQP